jgi:hypothetical protein
MVDSPAHGTGAGALTSVRWRTRGLRRDQHQASGVKYRTDLREVAYYSCVRCRATAVDINRNVKGMTMETANVPFYSFDTHGDAEAAIRRLNASGFDMKKLSLVGKGYHSEEHPIGFYSVGDRVRAWGGVGAFWGGIWGLLLAPAVFFLPGLGLVAMAGPVVSALVGALEGAVVVGGISALGAAIAQSGFSKEEVIKYETALKADKYVLTVHGTVVDAAKARGVLAAAEIKQAA